MLSTSGISSSAYSSNAQSQFQQIRKDFQQLGQDLSSGKLSAAQADFVTLQNAAPQLIQSVSQSNSPIAQAFNQLSKDLQSGNLSAAQQDYTVIQQDLQSQASLGHHHHHRVGGTQQSQFPQLFSQLGQALKSNNLSGAQQAFNSLQQLMPSTSQFATSSGSARSVTGSLSIYI